MKYVRNDARRLHRVLLLLVLVTLLLAVVVAPASAQGGRAAGVFFAQLSGENEVPGPGDPDGFGLAAVFLNANQEVVCWVIRVGNIVLPATGAHIHRGTEEEAGPVVVGLAPPDENGTSRGCTTADPELIRAILANPEGYYVNVHSTEYPAGAVRDQLQSGMH